jgi:hypothetical protein
MRNPRTYRLASRLALLAPGLWLLASPQELNAVARARSLECLAQRQFAVDRSVTSVLWIAEVGEGAPSDKAKALRDELLPWIAELEAQFVQRIAEPLSLPRSPDRPRLTVLALADPATRAAVAAEAKQLSGTIAWQGYHQGLAAVVTDAGLRPSRPSQERNEVLRGAVLALVEDYATPSLKKNPPAAFLLEGLSRYLGDCSAASPQDLGHTGVTFEDLEAVQAMLSDSGDAPETFFSLGNMLDARTRDDVLRLADFVAKERKLPAPDPVLAYDKFARLCGLWAHFLLDAEEGRYRRAFFTYLKSVCNGDPSGLRLRVALGMKDFKEIDAYFKAWAVSRFRVLGGNVDRSVAEKKGAALLSQVIFPKSSAYSAARMAIAEADVDARHAQALGRAREGDFDAALAELAALEAAAQEHPSAAVIAADRARMEGFLSVRNAWLDRLIQKGTKLAFQIQGKKFSASVKAREATRIVLGENSAGREALTWQELDGPWLAAQIPSDATAAEDAWKRFVPDALVDGPRLKALEKEQTPSAAATALIADARGRYPALVEVGRAAARIGELAQSGLPQDRAEAERCLERLKALLETYRGTPLVRARMESINALAAGCAEKLFDLQGYFASMGATATDQGEGRWKLAWSFDKPEELAAFRVEPSYLQERREGKPELKLYKDKAKLQVSKGALRSQGQHLLRLRPEFIRPFSIRIQFAFGGVPKGGAEMLDVEFGICDDQRGNLLVLDPWGNIALYDPSGKSSKLVEGQGKIDVRIDKPYAVEVRHDGKQVVLSVDGQTVNSSECKSRLAGGLLVLFHSDATCALPALEIEGLLDQKAAERDHLYGILDSLGLF